MPKIEPLDKSLKDLVGRHLWHAGMSSCSQRVRIVLAEMDQDFTSNIVRLEANEHASAAYQAIHPDGVVPAFVQDGELYVESIDIIQKIAGEEGDLAQTGDGSFLKMADEAQKDLKLLTFEFLFRSGGGPSQDAKEAFEKGHQNDALKAFKREFAQGFTEERLEAGIKRTADGFKAMNERLSDGRSFLEGETFTLSDVAWMPNFHRMDLMDWPFEQTPFVKAWFDRVSARESYQKGLADWEKPEVIERFRAYTQERKAEGTSVGQSKTLSGKA